jgi:hypothetical protein
MLGDVRGSKRTKALAAALLLALLSLPLILIISSTLQPSPPRGKEVLPLFPASQARALASYRSPCLRPEECGSPLGCLEAGELGRGECLNTECETASQCEPEEYCRTFQTMGGGLALRRCDRRDGLRPEGDACVEGYTYAEDRCAQGLLCNRGWCGRPCRFEEASDCPEGFFCQQGLDGPSCVPTCEARGCPEGLQCAREAGGISVCAQLRGSGCPADSCPESSHCTFTNLSLVDAGLALRQECIAPCGEGKPACPSGRVCIASRCLRTCDPQGPGTCYPEERCIYRVDLGAALCKQIR